MLTPPMLASSTFHLISEPSRCLELVTDILARRKDVTTEYPKLCAGIAAPTFVWEPMEGSCRPSELPSFYKALKFVDVFSPNEHELDLLFNGPKPVSSESMLRAQLHNYCKKLFDLGFGDKPCAIIVRTGAAGCVVASQNCFTNFPAYHRPPVNSTSEESATWYGHKTMNWDVTGGGNAFLGGFCMGLAWLKEREQNPGLTEFESAAVYGSVAASFAIEQVGMPKLSRQPESGKEMWNEDGKRLSQRRFLPS